MAMANLCWIPDLLRNFNKIYEIKWKRFFYGLLFPIGGGGPTDTDYHITSIRWHTYGISIDIPHFCVREVPGKEARDSHLGQRWGNLHVHLQETGQNL